MRAKIYIKFFTVSLLCSSTAFSDHLEDTGAISDELGIEKLISESLTNNFELKALKQDLVAKEAETNYQTSLDDPMVAVEASNYPVGSFSDREEGMTGKQVSVSQKFSFPGKRSRKQKAIELEAESLKFKVRAKELELTKEIKKIYAELYFSFVQLNSLQNQKTIFDNLLKSTGAFTLSGGAKAGDLSMIRLDRVSLENQILESDRMISVTLGELNHMLGRFDHGAYLSGKVISLPKVDAQKYIAKQMLLQNSLLQNPRLKEKELKLESAKENMRVSDLNYYPGFEARASYMVREKTPESSGKDLVSFMLGWSVPLYGAVKQSEEKRASSAKMFSEEAMMQEEKTNLAHLLHKAYSELKEEQAKLQLIDTEAMPAATSALNLIKASLASGKASIIDYLAMSKRKIDWQIMRARAEANIFTKISEIDELAGSSFGEKL